MRRNWKLNSSLPCDETELIQGSVLVGLGSTAFDSTSVFGYTGLKRTLVWALPLIHRESLTYGPTLLDIGSDYRSRVWPTVGTKECSRGNPATALHSIFLVQELDKGFTWKSDFPRRMPGGRFSSVSSPVQHLHIFTIFVKKFGNFKNTIYICRVFIRR